MSKPVCTSGEPWDNEGALNEMMDILTDKTNGDILMFIKGVYPEWMEVRMSPDAAVRLGLTLVKVATGADTTPIWDAYLKTTGR